MPTFGPEKAAGGNSGIKNVVEELKAIIEEFR